MRANARIGRRRPVTRRNPRGSRLPRRVVATALLALALAGCARGMAVGSEPRPVHNITVQNDLTEAMIVSYTDARGDAILGTVPPGSSERFVIASPATTITVRARNTAGTRVIGPYTLDFTSGTSQLVHLR